MRPVVATVEIVALGVAAHAGAGGTLPSPDVLLALVGLVGAVSVGLHLRLLRMPVAAFLTVAAQAVVHTAGSPPADSHAHHATATTADEHMLLAHAVSTLVTIGALVWQEQVLGAFARALVPLAPAVAPASWARPPMRSRAVPRSSQLLLALAPRRGPPLTPASAVS